MSRPGIILRRLALIVALAGGFYAPGPAAQGALVIDQSDLDTTSGLGTSLGGKWYGFEFTTPAGPSFELGEIRAAFSREANYAGDTDFQLFTRSGADLTPFSSRVTIPDSDIYTGFLSFFEFATDAIIADFSSQSLMLSGNTTYSFMGEHNGSGPSASFTVILENGNPVSDTVILTASASLDDANERATLDPVFQIFDTAPVPEPGSALFLGLAALFFCRFRRARAATLLAAASLLLFTSPARAALILDESGFSPTATLSSDTAGNWRGFEFTTGGSDFEVGVIKGAWYQDTSYSGASDVQLFTRSGLDLTPISTPVSVAAFSTVSFATFDFATDAATVDFSSQTITLSANTAYTILAQHNGSAAAFMGIYRAGGDPTADSGRIDASASLDDALYIPTSDIPFQVYDTAPVPEPASAFFLGLAALFFCRFRRARATGFLAGIAMFFFISTPAAQGALLLDHSSLTVLNGTGTTIGGNWVGFEFTTPAGPSFELGEIRVAYNREAGYVGDTDFQLFTRSGADLTALSARVTIADSGIYSGNIITYDFSTDAVIVDFSSQSLMLSGNTTYSLMAEHNGSGDTFRIRYQGSDPVSDAGVLSASASLDDAVYNAALDPPFQLFDTTPVPEPASALSLGLAALFFCRFRRARAVTLLAAASLLLFTSPARAALILDESGFSPTATISSDTAGNWRGFEFTTGGSDFEVGVIEGAWYQDTSYSGATDVQLFTRSGLDLTPISTPVSVAAFSTVSFATFDFATDAATVDFSSQSITLSANTAYTVLAQHNGSAAAFMGIYRAGGDPTADSGRIDASASLDDALYIPTSDIPFQVYDTAPVPEPGSALFLGLAALFFCRFRRARAVTLLAAASLLLFTSPAPAALVLDESAFSENGRVSHSTAGIWRGFEFTTGGSAFEVGVIKAGWYQSSGYTGNSNVQLFTRSGADLTAISTPVSVAGFSSDSLFNYEFVDDGTSVDFSSQMITLSASTAYVVAAEHNGSPGEQLGVYVNNTDPTSGSGRIEASSTLDDAVLFSATDVQYQVYDTAPVPELSSLSLFLAAQAALIAHRRR